MVNKPPKAMQSHINQSESAGPNPVQPTIALAKNIGNIYTSELKKNSLQFS